jgi:thymidylate synthase
VDQILKTYKNFTSAYIDLARMIRDNFDFEVSPRGMKVKEKLGVQFRITNPRNRLPYVKGRNFSLSYFVAESIWYMSGSNSTEWISKYAPFWRNISDDGVTANSAYGARIFKTNPRIAGSQLIQWNYVLEELRRDPDSRRAVIHIRTPDDSISAKKDMPCTLSLQFFIRENKLHLHVSMRSSDVILGLAYDVPAFTLMQEVMANDLGVELGEYVHTSNSLHCYDRDYEMLNDIANTQLDSNFENSNYLEMPPLPKEFPTDELFKLEANVSKMKNEVDPIVNFDGQPTSESVHLIQDWIFILRSAQARKMKNQFLCDQYINLTSFNGYHYFRR